MSFLTKLPANADWFQRLTYPFARRFFYFVLTFLPYAPIRRVNKPKLSGAYLWASNHPNYLSDTVPPYVEGDVPVKFLAKSTLFKFPIKAFIEYCGALPITRPEDGTALSKEERLAQNRNTFLSAVTALEQGWPRAIFP